jgi:hypothetical protein
LIHALTTTYERGVRISKAAFRPIAERLIRSETLWSAPQKVVQVL